MSEKCCNKHNNNNSDDPLTSRRTDGGKNLNYFYYISYFVLITFRIPSFPSICIIPRSASIIYLKNMSSISLGHRPSFRESKACLKLAFPSTFHGYQYIHTNTLDWYMHFVFSSFFLLKHVERETKTKENEKIDVAWKWRLWQIGPKLHHSQQGIIHKNWNCLANRLLQSNNIGRQHGSGQIISNLYLNSKDTLCHRLTENGKMSKVWRST